MEETGQQKPSGSEQGPGATRVVEYVECQPSTNNTQLIINGKSSSNMRRPRNDHHATYTDAGKSGLRIDGRDALKELIRDVENGQANFSAILVYDVSRWDDSRMPTRAPITSTFADAED